MDQPDLYAWATDGFVHFTDVWDFDDFWTRANTFEAYVRFVEAARAKWPTDPNVAKMETFLQKMAQTNAAYFTKNLTISNWADDYGWCGIASLAARDYFLSIGNADLAARFLGIAQACWDTMYKTGYDRSNTARPVPHGCGNGSAGDPGTKNTVTNANLFVLSLRLYEALKPSGGEIASKYLDMTFLQYLWFKSWFESDYGYLRFVSSGSALVQERPIAPPDYENKDRPPWEPGWTWSADQGLVLAALAGLYGLGDDLESVNPDVDIASVMGDVQTWIDTIVTGVGALLFDSPDNVLREAPFKSAFEDDPKDYVCGRGVLLRYLVQPELRAFVGSRFDTGIGATAEAVWNSRDGKNQFGAAWNPANDPSFNDRFAKLWGYGDTWVTWPYDAEPGPPVDGILQAAGLDVIGAAIPILAST
jgi:hypothetical protein